MRSSKASILFYFYASLLACSGAPASDLVSSPVLPSDSGNIGTEGDGGLEANAGDASVTAPNASSDAGAPNASSDAGAPNISNDSGPSGDDAIALGSSDASAAMPPSDGAVLGADAPASSSTDAGAYVQMGTATLSTGFAPVIAATLPNPETAGDLNVVAIGWGDSITDVAEVSDSAGNTYRLAVGPTRTAGVSQSIYYASGITALPGRNTVQVLFIIPTARMDLGVVEYAGFDRTAPLDAVAAMSGVGTRATSGTAMTHAASELIFAAGTSTDTFSAAGSLFTLRILTTNGALVEDRTVSSPGTYAAAATLSHSVNWAMQAATFR